MPKLNSRQRFGANLKDVRLSKGLSQEDLADLCGLHRTCVGSVERGERSISIDNMERLADSLEVPLEKLIREGKA